MQISQPHTNSHKSPPNPAGTEVTRQRTYSQISLALMASHRREDIDARRPGVRVGSRAVRAIADGADGVLAADLRAATRLVLARDGSADAAAHALIAVSQVALVLGGRGRGGQG